MRLAGHSWRVNKSELVDDNEFALVHWQVVAAKAAKAGEQEADDFQYSVFLVVEVADRAIVSCSVVAIVTGGS